MFKTGKAESSETSSKYIKVDDGPTLKLGKVPEMVPPPSLPLQSAKSASRSTSARVTYPSALSLPKNFLAPDLTTPPPTAAVKFPPPLRRTDSSCDLQSPSSIIAPISPTDGSMAAPVLGTGSLPLPTITKEVVPSKDPMGAAARLKKESEKYDSFTPKLSSTPSDFKVPAPSSKQATSDRGEPPSLQRVSPEPKESPGPSTCDIAGNKSLFISVSYPARSVSLGQIRGRVRFWDIII